MELALSGDTTGARREIGILQDSAASEYDIGMRAFVLARTGDRAAAEATIRRLERRPVGRRPNAVMIGYVHAGLAEWDRALAEFIKGAEQHQWGGTYFGRELNPIRGLPRYAEFMRKMNLQDQPVARASAQ